MRQQISTARNLIRMALRTLFRPAAGDHNLRVYKDHSGVTATCTCVDEYGDAWFFWDESSLLVAQQVHLHLVPDELLHG